jgi:hypothetical protein
MIDIKHNYDSLAFKKVESKMRPKDKKKLNIPLNECTEFSMHISQTTSFQDKLTKMIDYSECKLRRYIETVEDKQQKLVLQTLLQDYIKGNLAIAWRRGQLVYINVTKA